MSEKIDVLDIGIDGLTAKEAMKNSMEYMVSDPISIIEMVTVDGLMQIREFPEIQEELRRFDLVLAGDRTILEAAEVTERRFLQETENKTFLKMFIRYLHKNHKRVYLLVESGEEGDEFYGYLERAYSGIQIVGLAKVSAEDRADDMLVNDINGGEVDCVFAALSSPLREEFVAKNRGILNARVWLGIGKDMFPQKHRSPGKERFTQFIVKHIFKKEIEKRKVVTTS